MGSRVSVPEIIYKSLACTEPHVWMPLRYGERATFHAIYTSRREGLRTTTLRRRWGNGFGIAPGQRGATSGSRSDSRATRRHSSNARDTTKRGASSPSAVNTREGEGTVRAAAGWPWRGDPPRSAVRFPVRGIREKRL